MSAFMCGKYIVMYLRGVGVRDERVLICTVLEVLFVNKTMSLPSGNLEFSGRDSQDNRQSNY